MDHNNLAFGSGASFISVQKSGVDTSSDMKKMSKTIMKLDLPKMDPKAQNTTKSPSSHSLTQSIKVDETNQR